LFFFIKETLPAANQPDANKFIQIYVENYKGQFKLDKQDGFGESLTHFDKCGNNIRFLSYDYEKAQSNLSYAGKFADGYKSGQGEEIWLNLHKYVGKFYRGLKCDQKGTFTSALGDTYEGGYQLDKRCGYGEGTELVHFSDESIWYHPYTKYFKGGHGDKVVVRCMWENGRKSGPGEFE
jgi:hypothetical protein